MFGAFVCLALAQQPIQEELKPHYPQLPCWQAAEKMSWDLTQVCLDMREAHLRQYGEIDASTQALLKTIMDESYIWWYAGMVNATPYEAHGIEQQYSFTRERAFNRLRELISQEDFDQGRLPDIGRWFVNPN